MTLHDYTHKPILIQLFRTILRAHSKIMGEELATLPAGWATYEQTECIYHTDEYWAVPLNNFFGG